MINTKTTLYFDAIEKINASTLKTREEKKEIPEFTIVATHGPALVKSILEDPTTLDMIGIYRLNCSHLGKETDLDALAQYLQVINKSTPVLIDLQGPKPRIHEMKEGDITVHIWELLEVTYESGDSDERFCLPWKLKVCFPEIVDVMEIGDIVIFDDGKMMAKVVQKETNKAVIQCSEILSGKEEFVLWGRKWICVRNRPLGISCITDHDRKSIEYARDMIGFENIDTIMVSYFSTNQDIEHFIHVMRDEYWYHGNLGWKFETPHAVMNAAEILEKNDLTLTMLGRWDLRVEMDPRALPNLHNIQSHFFTTCRKYEIESICATGFLESMIPPEGKVTDEEIRDMEISMKTGPNHLMLSWETSYGSQATQSIIIERDIQVKMYRELMENSTHMITPEWVLSDLLYINK